MDMRVLFLFNPISDKIKQKYSDTMNYCYGFIFGYAPPLSEEREETKFSDDGSKVWTPVEYAVGHLPVFWLPGKSMDEIKRDIDSLGSRKSPGKPLFIAEYLILCGGSGTIEEVE